MQKRKTVFFNYLDPLCFNRATHSHEAEGLLPFVPRPKGANAFPHCPRHITGMAILFRPLFGRTTKPPKHGSLASPRPKGANAFPHCPRHITGMAVLLNRLKFQLFSFSEGGVVALARPPWIDDWKS
jgi:hypothetical protein